MQVVYARDGSPLHIRAICPDDGERLGEMLQGCSEETRRFFHPYPLTRESGMRVASDQGIVCLIAVADGGEIAGYVWIENEGNYPCLGICVGDKWQSRGVGHILMKRIIEEAKRLNHKGIYLTVMQDNQGGIHLYEKYGFITCGNVADPEGPAKSMRLCFGPWEPQIPASEPGL